MNPKVFGWQHLLYELFFIIFYISIIIIFVKLLKIEKSKKHFFESHCGSFVCSCIMEQNFSSTKRQ